MPCPKSEVARLRARITAECQALQTVATGFARTATHEMIAHRFQAMSAAQNELASLVGEKTAAETAAMIYCEVVQ